VAEILLIEDDLRLRNEVQGHLEQTGHDVLCASDGEEGLNSLRELGCHVVILDIRLPDLSGIEVLRRMAQRFPSHPPVIIMTGHADKETAIRALRFGAFDLLEKPFMPQALDTSISRALLEKRQDLIGFKNFLSTSKGEKLTQRENEVAHLAAQGLSTGEIGQKLSLGTETIKSHLKKVFRKLGVRNRAALGAYLLSGQKGSG